MKYISITLFIFTLFGFTLLNTEREISLGEKFDIQINDSTQIEIQQVLSKTSQLPIYYFSDLYIAACNTGECKMINMKIFWDVYGNYFKYEVKKSDPLTKFNHKRFKTKEYTKLHLLLCDTASKFKNVAFNHLTEKQAGKVFKKADASSGATIKLFTSDNIKGAVKTVHTLWHIANGKVKERIYKASEKLLESEKNQITKTKKTDNINTANLTTLAYLISTLDGSDISKNEEYKEILEAIYNSKDKDAKMLISNYFFRTDISNKKAKRFINNYKFLD